MYIMFKNKYDKRLYIINKLLSEDIIYKIDAELKKDEDIKYKWNKITNKKIYSKNYLLDYIHNYHSYASSIQDLGHIYYKYNYCHKARKMIYTGIYLHKIFHKLINDIIVNMK